MRTVERIAALICAIATGALAAVLAYILWAALEVWRQPEVPAEVPAGQVVRRLELRLSEPLDKGRGDRYRTFECREVPRQ